MKQYISGITYFELNISDEIEIQRMSLLIEKEECVDRYVVLVINAGKIILDQQGRL